LSILNEDPGLAPFSKADETALRAGLCNLKPGSLIMRGIAAGVDPDALEKAHNEGDDAAIIGLIVKSHSQSKEHLRLPEHRWRNKLGESTTDPDMIDVDSVTASPDQITKWLQFCPEAKAHLQVTSGMLAFACHKESVASGGEMLEGAGALYTKFNGAPLDRVVSPDPRFNGFFGKCDENECNFFVSGTTLIVRDFKFDWPGQVFVKRLNTDIQQFGPDCRFQSEPECRYFGVSVAFSGDTLVIGSPAEDNWDGAIYTQMGDEKLIRVASLEPAGSMALVGAHVSFSSEDTIFVAAPRANVGNVFNAGAAHFQPIGQEFSRITAKCPCEWCQFSMQMIVDGTTLAISTAEEVSDDCGGAAGDAAEGKKTAAAAAAGDAEEGKKKKTAAAAGGGDAEEGKKKKTVAADDGGVVPHPAMGEAFEPTDSNAWVKDKKCTVRGGRCLHPRWEGVSRCENMFKGGKLRPPMPVSNVCMHKYCQCCNACGKLRSPSTQWQYVMYMRAADDQPLERFASEESQHSSSRSEMLLNRGSETHFGLVARSQRTSGSSHTQVSNGTVLVFTPYEDGGKGVLYFKTYGKPVQRITGFSNWKLTDEPDNPRHRLKYGQKMTSQSWMQPSGKYRQGWSQKSFVRSLSSNRRPGSLKWHIDESETSRKFTFGFPGGFWSPDLFYNDRIFFRDGMLVIPSLVKPTELAQIYIKRGDNDFEIMKEPSLAVGPKQGVYQSQFGYQIQVKGETVITSDPVASVSNGRALIPKAGSVFVSKTAGHLETISSISPKTGNSFGKAFDYVDSKLLVSLGINGGGAELITNGTAIPVFPQETIEYLYLDLPEALKAEEVATTPNGVKAAGWRKEFNLDAAVSRVQALSPTGSLNCSALNGDMELQTNFAEWEVDKVNGAPDFTKRVTCVIEATGWRNGSSIPARTLQFQFLKKEKVLKSDSNEHLGTLGKNLVCLVEIKPSTRPKVSAADKELLEQQLRQAEKSKDYASALHLQQLIAAHTSSGNSGASSCCTRKLLSVSPADRPQFVAHLKLW